MITSADLSPCGTYRYRLWRQWDPALSSVLWVMLNPSTADATKDDPTIRKCIGFAQRWGYGAITVVNLFAFRGTKPSSLLTHMDPVGPENDSVLSKEFEMAERIMLAWGSHAELRSLVSARLFHVRRLLRGNEDCAYSLGHAADGSPRHPLMLSYDTPITAVESP